MSGAVNPKDYPGGVGYPGATAAERALIAADQLAADQRAQLALKLGVSVDDLARQALANVGSEIAALSHQVGQRDEQRSRVEAGLGLSPGSLAK